MEDIINIIINNGVTVGVLVYFIYRDNKYITQLTQAIQKLQDTLDTMKKGEKNEE